MVAGRGTISPGVKCGKASTQYEEDLILRVPQVTGVKAGKEGERKGF